MFKILFVCFFLLSFGVFSQPILKENLTRKQTTYWDFNKSKVQAVGTYYKDDLGETTIKHGKWEFFDRLGKTEEIRNYYKGQLHGAVLLKYPNGTPKQEGYFKRDLQDSVYREWNESGKLTLEGNFREGQTFGIWKYFYDDGRQQKQEENIDSTVLLQAFWLPDSLHTQTVIEGTGELTVFYNTGTLKEWYNYKNGLLDGRFEDRSIFGYELLSGTYLQGKKTGEWKYAYYTGTTEKISHYENDLLNGKYTYFYDNGKVNVEGNYTDGLKEGVWTWYTNQGTRDMSGTFKNDLQDGTWTYWYPTGEVSYTAQYKAGLKDGTWSYYYKDGTKFKQGTFAADEKNGTWETWYEDGTLLMTGKYQAGKEEGKWMNYWESGTLKNESTFRRGVLHGTWKSYYPKGTLKLVGEYEEGFKNGEWTDYFENGKPKDIANYKVIREKSKMDYGIMKDHVRLESIKHGHFTSFSAKDYRRTEEGDFKDGQKHGEWIAYYPGGKMPAVSSTYKHGKLDGPMREYGRRGELTSEVMYKDGLKDGSFKIFDKRGNVVSEKKFENGMQVIENKTNTQGGFSPGK
jgi:antitoxin component YwqK of YwqJK toxin-antitoxin module